jgi:hypothetical protein
MAKYKLFVAHSIAIITMYASYFVACARVCVLEHVDMVVDELLAESPLASRSYGAHYP